MDGAGREFCQEKRRILEGEEVSDFGWRCVRGVRNYAVARVFVFATERVFVFATERVFVFATGEVLAFAPGQVLVRI